MVQCCQSPIIKNIAASPHGQAIRFCSRICHVGGRILSAHTTHRNFCQGNFVAFVGEDIIFPVVFPVGKQRRRNAPTTPYRTFPIKILLYNIETWYIGNIGAPVWSIWFCSKICHIGRRILSAPTQTVPPNYRRKNTPPNLGVNLLAANFLLTNGGCCV